ncbi:MAG: hypothetical protein PVI81_05455 [Anaerolineales bacterium]|jgi:hypothetical protein
MRSRGSSLRLPLTILSIFATLLLIFLSRTDLGNWLKKSDYALWSQNLESELTAQKAELLMVDFGTLPEDDEEFYVVVEIAEPQHEYEFERLFADLQKIVIETYLQTEPVPEQPDTIAAIVNIDSGLRMAVLAPFDSAMEYFQGTIGYESWIDTWEFGFDVSEGFKVEE